MGDKAGNPKGDSSLSGSAPGGPPHTTTLTTPSSLRRGAFVPTFTAGDVLSGRYQVVRFIAHGGMGEVYEVEDQELGVQVALKTVRPDIAEQEGALDRFKREIHLARRISHPNVCKTFDIGHHRMSGGGAEHEVTFMTMELLEGETLSQRVRRDGKLSPAAALPIVRQMAAALATAHEAGVVHRDFKGSNVVLCPSKGGERAVVTDFGLARAAIGETTGGIGDSLTGTGTLIGTPAYMAPEQLQGRAVGPAADIYSLGVVIYEMVTASMPFTGDSPLSIALKRLQEKPVPPRRVVADLSPKWEAVILRCMELRPADRFASAGDVARFLEGEGVAPGRRRRRRLAAAVALSLALALAAGYLLSRAFPRLAVAPSSDAALAPAAPKKSVAVLGFKNLGKPESDWLSTALSEMLRTELAAGDRLRTIPGESVARARLELSLGDVASLTEDTLATVGRNLGADLVASGSYLAVGPAADKIRLDLRVQDTRQGRLVVAVSEEGTEDEFFRLVSSTGAKMRAALGIGAVPATEMSALRGAFPAHPQAAQLYSEGLARLRAFDPQEARGLLEKAVAVEPGQPLIHAALARAWSSLGYDQKARAESKRAFELSQGLPREERLTVHGLHYETTGEWEEAVDTYKALLVFFPEKLDYGLQLAAAQVGAGQGEAALATIAQLRALPPAIRDDPRLDLAESAAAKAVTDFPRQREAASRASLAAERQGARLLQAQALLAEGTALVNLGQLQEGRRLCERAGEVFAAAGDRASVARSQNIVAVAYARNGDIALSKEKFEAALQAFRSTGDKKGIALQQNNVAGALVELGQTREGLKLYEEARDLSREIGDRSGVARALNNIGSVLELRNELPASQRAFEEALVLFRELGEARNEALALSNVGEVLERQRKPAAAREKYEASIVLSRRIGAKDDTALTLGLLAQAFVAEGNREAARRALEESLALWREVGDRGGEAEALRAIAALPERRAPP